MLNLKRYFERNLTHRGYTKITWHYGNYGYFITAVAPDKGGTVTININDVVESILFSNGVPMTEE